MHTKKIPNTQQCSICAKEEVDFNVKGQIKCINKTHKHDLLDIFSLIHVSADKLLCSF